MHSTKVSALVGVLSLVSSVAAHGHVRGMTIDGVWVGGWEIDYYYTSKPPAVPGWSTKALDNGFVEPAAYGTADIACHKSALPGKTHAKVAAGSTIDIAWDTWPESHHGPVIDALAPCGADCSTTTADSLKFFVIGKAGLIDSSTNPGKWATDELIANNNTWSLKIPADIKPGRYVLRHELIALHGAGDANGAQNYPQCLNLEITGSGTATPAGIPATEFYTAKDPGILVGIWWELKSYVIPGPAVYSSSPVQAPPPTSQAPSSTSTASPIIISAEPTPSTAAPVTTTSAPVLVPTSISPPFSNTTTPPSTTSQSACKIETTATPTASAPPTMDPYPSPVGEEEEEYPVETNVPATIIVIPTPESTATPTPVAPSEPISTPMPPTTEMPAPVPVESLPAGTKLSTVLAWIANFYSTHKEGEYSSETAMRKRAHARHVRL